jgi:hypothetical protein
MLCVISSSRPIINNFKFSIRKKKRKKKRGGKKKNNKRLPELGNDSSLISTTQMGSTLKPERRGWYLYRCSRL